MGVPFESVYTWYRKHLKANKNVRYWREQQLHRSM
jgi:hypothetical protein